jgi:hypothetical protein
MASRRVNGEGTIYRRKDGRYEVAIFVSTTSGQIKRVRKYAASRGEADRKLTELKTKLQQGIPVPDKSVRIADYLDYWLSEIIKPTRRWRLGQAQGPRDLPEGKGLLAHHVEPYSRARLARERAQGEDQHSGDTDP